jgi:hypothetical protein
MLWWVPSVFGTLLHGCEAYRFFIEILLLHVLKLSKKTGLVHKFGNVEGCQRV